ncbi:MAG: hypothetical protein DMF69_21375 [Acidobacteria bacterium]|nr:MAG: hypothetical protein DMF69_21375 [Acidobacteriota bacterium]
MEREFSRVFESGEIERIEQETATTRGEIRHWLISKIPMWGDTTGQVSHVITVGEEVTDRVEANRAVARAESWRRWAGWLLALYMKSIIHSRPYLLVQNRSSHALTKALSMPRQCLKICASIWA